MVSNFLATSWAHRFVFFNQVHQLAETGILHDAGHNLLAAETVILQEAQTDPE